MLTNMFLRDIVYFSNGSVSGMEGMVSLCGLKLPEVWAGADLARLIAEAAETCCSGLKDGDVVVVTSKVVLKAKGLVFRLEDIKPSLAAKAIAVLTGKNSREVELVLRAADDVIAVLKMRRPSREFLQRISPDPDAAEELFKQIPALLVVRTRQGLIAMDGGVDYSNLPPGYAIANVSDFDEEARELRRRLREVTGREVAVVISDTESNTSGKLGTVDVAVGCSGIKPVTPYFASKDRYGRPKFGGIDIVVDELASAAALLMGQTSESVPAVVVRGLRYEVSDEGVKDYTIRFKGLSFKEVLRNALVKLIYRTLYRRVRR